MATIKKVSTKKGVGYKIDYYDLNGFRHRETHYVDYSTAKVIAADLEIRKNRVLKGFESVIDFELTLQKAIDRYLDNAVVLKDDKTIKREKQVYRAFKEFLGTDFLINKTKLRHMEKYVQKRFKIDGLSPATVGIEIRTLKRFFNYLIEHSYTKSNPTSGLKGPKIVKKKIRFLSSDEIVKLLEVIDSDDYTDLVLMYLHTGARREELLPKLFTWKNVEFENRLMRIVGKRDKVRYIPMNDTAFEILKKRKERGEVVPFKLNYEYIYKKIKKYYKKAGIQDADIHTLRRTYGSLLVQGGTDIFRVQKLLGHSSVKTTEECYADLRQDDLKKSVKQLSKLLDRALKESRKNN